MTNGDIKQKPKNIAHWLETKFNQDSEDEIKDIADKYTKITKQ